MESVVWEHPEKGTCRVWYTWKRADPWGFGEVFSWDPVAVEFDLFTLPANEREMLRDLRKDQELERKVRKRHLTPRSGPSRSDSSDLPRSAR